MRETRARKNAFNGMNCAINAPQMQLEPVDVELNMISAELQRFGKYHLHPFSMAKYLHSISYCCWLPRHKAQQAHVRH
jgi:hypothetical protein